MPVMIFLSDGECSVPDSAIQDLCRTSIRLGCVIIDYLSQQEVTDFAQSVPLSFHAISFGQDCSSSSLRRMANLALGIQNNAPGDPFRPPAASVDSSYSVALDTVSD